MCNKSSSLHLNLHNVLCQFYLNEARETVLDKTFKNNVITVIEMYSKEAKLDKSHIKYFTLGNMN